MKFIRRIDYTRGGTDSQMKIQNQISSADIPKISLALISERFRPNVKSQLRFPPVTRCMLDELGEVVHFVARRCRYMHMN